MNIDDNGSLWPVIQPLLLRVGRPSRYMGGEWNSSEIPESGTRVVLAYPDVYEIGTSNLGLAILREVVNAIEGASAERAYSPWTDMEAAMRASGIPLFTLETHRPVRDCDLFGISIPHELTYTNILNLIDLAGLPLRSDERTGGPLVVGGGCGTANPEPLAEFFDLFVLGDGEQAVTDIVLLLERGKKHGWDRAELLERASRIGGVYRPSCYTPEYNEDGTLLATVPGEGAPARVAKRVDDPDVWLLPKEPLVPFCEAVHDRVNIEIFRGCTRGCRFCQAGMTMRPVRERAAGSVVMMADELTRGTGYDEVSLCSLSSTDYTRIADVAGRIIDLCEGRHIDLSLPSLRMDGESAKLAARVDRGGRGGLTFAPEAGSDRLRKAINKDIEQADMVAAVVNSVAAGRRRIKLYFMIGLPGETDEDVGAISRLVFSLRDAVKAEGLAPPSFNVSVATFVPKPHTPFQWCAQDRIEDIVRKQGILKQTLRAKSVNLSWHDPEMSTVEGLLARGDRRLARLVHRAWASGARFDSWSEHFDFQRWMSAAEDVGIDPGFFLYRKRGGDEVFPWDHLDFGVDREFLRAEYDRAARGEVTGDCRWTGCADCGVCRNLGVEPSLKGAGTDA